MLILEWMSVQSQLTSFMDILYTLSLHSHLHREVFQNTVSVVAAAQLQVFIFLLLLFFFFFLRWFLWVTARLCRTYHDLPQ